MTWTSEFITNELPSDFEGASRALQSSIINLYTRDNAPWVGADQVRDSVGGCWWWWCRGDGGGGGGGSAHVIVFPWIYVLFSVRNLSDQRRQSLLHVLLRLGSHIACV